ncbi:MAG TPA: hypothetical protein DCR40_03640 [Prolixibacteraceae bacterium]|nr:hypothetical protein [Prolixibacteraceae bacterium]
MTIFQRFQSWETVATRFFTYKKHCIKLKKRIEFIHQFNLFQFNCFFYINLVNCIKTSKELTL